MIGPNETLGSPRTVAARLRTTSPLGWVEFLGKRESCEGTRYIYVILESHTKILHDS